MSDNIPFEIQVEIINRLPVKSLIQVRTVSKAWKSLIDGSDFMSGYRGQVQHLLVNYSESDDKKYVSIVDDDTFPQQKVSPTVPLLVDALKRSEIICSSHGLMCLYGSYGDYYTPTRSMVVLWNISLRKAIAIVEPSFFNRYAYKYGIIIGFGVCPETNDSKILKIRYIKRNTDITSNYQPVQVFTLSSGAWRSPYNDNNPRKSIEFYYSQVAKNEFLYWLARDTIAMDSGFISYNLIMSFNITTEEFRELKLPNSLAHDRSVEDLCISKLRKSLVMLESDGVENNPTFIVWMMEDGVPELFTKLFTINTPNATILSVLEFRNNGEPIIEISECCGDFQNDSSLGVYEPNSKHINNLGIGGTDLSISVCSYIETLHLLHQPDSFVYGIEKNYIFKPRPTPKTPIRRKIKRFKV